MRAPVTRTIILWCPDWPVTQAAKARGLAPGVPIALTDRGAIFACSDSARKKGVTRGLRVREAQSRCPELLLFPYDPAPGARAFEPVLAAVEAVTPGVQAIRPGTCALRARGPSRYYGGEEQAAAALLACLDRLGVSEARVGIADGPFAAGQAARLTDVVLRSRIVPPGESARFLAPVPVEQLGLPELAPVLTRLGIYTLGDLAALGANEVRERFGPEGARAHLLAQGNDGSAVLPRTPPEDLARGADFEPPLDRVDQIAFAFRATADAFIAGLTRAGLVCTALRVEVTSEDGARSERTWLHPRVFDAADVLDRVRWQLQGAGSAGQGPGAPVARLLVAPESVDDIGHHEEGLWGSGADERIHHGLSRVQSMLGHDEVLTAVIGGGRSPLERQRLVPWGDRSTAPTRRDGSGPGAGTADTAPWPGSLPPPHPTSVFRVREPVTVLRPDGDPADVDETGALTGPLARFSPPGAPSRLQPISAWAGPWPFRERWWDPDPARRRSLQRFQVVDEEGNAWLLMLEQHRWWAEARYD